LITDPLQCTIPPKECKTRAAQPETAEEVVEEAGRCGSRVYAHQADVSQEDRVRAMFRRMSRVFGTMKGPP
jgi:NAD(P)-dependent dehydrogenase (short-subunit alcohol dehydrogenase family)